MVRIKITSLKEGVHHVQLRPEPEDLDLAPEEFSDIDLSVRLDNRTGRIFASFDVKARATLTCDRTLAQFEQEVSGSYDLLFTAAEIADDGDNEDMRVLDPNDQEIDITNAVRDTLMLSLPVRRVAPDAEDIDIPKQFGARGDDEVDYRWEALKKLKGNN